MTDDGPRWVVRLAAAAEADLRDIVRWTLRRFGARQARTYASTLTAAVLALGRGPTVAGARPRDDIGRGLFVLHVARGRRKGRHFIVFRSSRDEPGVVEILRVLHDAMDLARHVELPGGSED